MPEPSGPVGFILAMVERGMGPTAGLRAYREAGGSIRTERWFQAFAAMQGERSRFQVNMTAPQNRRPTAEEITRTPSQTPGKFVYRGGVLVWNRETGLAETRPAAVSTRRLITRGAATSQMALQIEEGTELGLTVLGAYVTAVRELTDPDEGL